MDSSTQKKELGKIQIDANTSLSTVADKINSNLNGVGVYAYYDSDSRKLAIYTKQTGSKYYISISGYNDNNPTHGQDAEISVTPPFGSTNEGTNEITKTFRSSTNTFSNVFGMSITVAKTNGGTVFHPM